LRTDTGDEKFTPRRFTRLVISKRIGTDDLEIEIERGKNGGLGKDRVSPDGKEPGKGKIGLATEERGGPGIVVQTSEPKRRGKRKLPFGGFLIHMAARTILGKEMKEVRKNLY